MKRIALRRISKLGYWRVADLLAGIRMSGLGLPNWRQGFLHQHHARSLLRPQIFLRRAPRRGLALQSPGPLQTAPLPCPGVQAPPRSAHRGPRLWDPLSGVSTLGRFQYGPPSRDRRGATGGQQRNVCVCARTNIAAPRPEWDAGLGATGGKRLRRSRFLRRGAQAARASDTRHASHLARLRLSRPTSMPGVPISTPLPSDSLSRTLDPRPSPRLSARPHGSRLPTSRLTRQRARTIGRPSRRHTGLGQTMGVKLLLPPPELSG